MASLSAALLKELSYKTLGDCAIRLHRVSPTHESRVAPDLPRALRDES